MKHKNLALITLVLGIAVPSMLITLQAQPQDEAHLAANNSKKQAVATKRTQQPEDDGQRVFEQNCSRCHNAPEGFSPRIAGTIVRHVRVRANLSEADARKLLRFFNP